MTSMPAPPNPVRAVLIPPEGPGRVLTGEQVEAWQPEDGLLWVHLDLADENSRAWIERQPMDEAAAEALLAEDTRPRTIHDGPTVLWNLRAVNRAKGEDPIDLVGLRTWTDGQRILSTRRRALHVVTRFMDDCLGEDPPRGAGEVLGLLGERIAEHFEPVLDQLESELDELEELSFEAGRTELRDRLSTLRSTLVRLRRHLAPQHAATREFEKLPMRWLGEEDRETLEHLADRFLRMSEDLEAFQVRAGIVQDHLQSRLSEGLERRMYTLTVVTAVFLPLSLLTSLLGINVGGIPGAQEGTAFWVVTAILMALVAVELWLLRLLRWI